jgi:hypothetical protein
MRVSEVLNFDSYYRDPRFAAKKADPRNWRTRCGDNIYFLNGAGSWTQGLAFFHTTPGQVEQDTRHPRVFVSDYYYYFGENAPEVPIRHRPLLKTRQGIRYFRGAAVTSFVEWIEGTYAMGMHGLPRDRESEYVPSPAESACEPRRTSRCT